MIGAEFFWLGKFLEGRMMFIHIFGENAYRCVILFHDLESRLDVQFPMYWFLCNLHLLSVKSKNPHASIGNMHEKKHVSVSLC